MITRRTFNRGLAAASTVGVASIVRAQEHYPSKPVRLLVGLAPGGISDITARIIAPRLGEILGERLKPVYVLLDSDEDVGDHEPAPLSEEELIERLKSEFDADEVADDGKSDPPAKEAAG